MQKSECYFLGKVTKPHGLKGEVTVWLDVDNPDYYNGLEAVFLEVKNQLVPYIIQEIQIRGKKSIAKFEGIEKIEATDTIVGSEMYLPLNKLPKLKGKQFYYHEVIGFEIYDIKLMKSLGSLKAIYESSGQDLFAIDHNETEILIPIVDEFISKIDREGKKIEISAPDGLLDVYLNP
jgi:16S rRNA processing protein RimM